MIVLIYRVVWHGEREGKEKRDNAIVRGVCTVSQYLHEKWGKMSSRGRISVQAGERAGKEEGGTDGWRWRGR